MTPERICLGLLALIALVMSINYVGATGRFLDANRAYDGLALTLETFEFTSAQEPVGVAILVENPADTDIDVIALNITLRAGLQSVGGGEIRVNEVLPAGASRLFEVSARITDQNIVRQLEHSDINWLIRGEIQVRVDEDLAPVWIQFSVRAITS